MEDSSRDFYKHTASKRMKGDVSEYVTAEGEKSVHVKHEMSAYACDFSSILGFFMQIVERV